MKNAAQHVVDLITTEEDKKFEPVARMADAIIDITINANRCELQDLLAQGFSQREISQFWHMANSMAAIELKHLSAEVLYA